MKLTILGSAAAEGWPALFCECEACEEARRRGGRNIRRRTAYAVNRDVLIDIGPDLNWQTSAFGVDLSRVAHVLLTHSHADHLAPQELAWRKKGFSVVTRPLTVYGNVAALGRIRNELPYTASELGLELRAVSPGESFPVGQLRVTPLAAQHASPGETALNFAITRGESAVLIANDTGWWPDETWDLAARFRFDVAVIECTSIDRYPDGRTHHLGFNSTIAFKEALAGLGCLKEGARVFANHFSHNGYTLHEELEERFRPHGIEPAYDGLVAEA